MTDSLHQRREALDRVRALFASGEDAVELTPTVRDSWERCRDAGSGSPVAPGGDTGVRLEDSPIEVARDLLEQLGEIAGAEDYLAVVTDHAGRILWSDGSAEMRRRAEAADFVPGADWSESSAGTNAPALSLVSDRPATVFAGEHWSEPVHDWVCYAAPIHDADGTVVGAIDLSSTWSRANGMAGATARSFAALVDHALSSRPRPSDGLEIALLGVPRVRMAGRDLHLTLRQVEILATLALQGSCTLDQLHAHVYGDSPVGLGTLKAEVSQLRKVLGGVIGSRPYRLTVPVSVDAVRLLDAVRRRVLPRALDLYRGQLLVDSESPLVTDERHYLDAALRSALLQSGDPSDLLRFADVHPYDAEILETARVRSRPDDPHLPLLSAALDRLDR